MATRDAASGAVDVLNGRLGAADAFPWERGPAIKFSTASHLGNATVKVRLAGPNLSHSLIICASLFLRMARPLSAVEGGVSIVEMLFCTSLVVQTGGGEHPSSSPRRLQLNNTKVCLFSRALFVADGSLRAAR